jgi:exonuclease III
VSTDGRLRIVALNLRYGGAPRVKAVTAALATHEPDLVVLSEAYPTAHKQVVLDALRAVGLEHRLTAESDTPQYPSAIALASRLPLEDVRQPLATGPNRQRLLEVRVGGILVAGAYFPLKKPKVEFWRNEFLPYAERHVAEAAILLGDWNSGQPYLDEAGATLYAAREFASLSEMGWVDAWRSTHGDGREFTWYSVKPHFNGFRIDHAFLSPSLAPRLLGARYDHSTRETWATDHSALVVDLRLSELPAAVGRALPSQDGAARPAAAKGTT